MNYFRMILVAYISIFIATNIYAEDINVNLLDTLKSTTAHVHKILSAVSNECKSTKSQSYCELVDNHGFEHLENGKLSAFWGYEFVGIDLMQRLLKGIDLATTKIATSEHVNLSELPKKVLSKELKSKLKNNYQFSGASHGTKVNNIILGDYPIGISSNAELSSTQIFNYSNNKFLLNADSFIQKGIKIFQASESIYDDKIDYLNKIIDAGVITVRSAGNRYPESSVQQSSPSLSIIVGQLSPLGVPSLSSSEGKSVTILAPGRNYSYGSGNYKLFGGTSGAQPVVTGCLANVVSILPGINQKEANSLLVKTSIPTLNSKDRVKKNGEGTINCYKLIRVALALKIDWPKTRALIESEETYDFSKESQELLNKADQINTTVSICSRREKLDLLREAFLLNPYNRNLILEISDIYQEAGFDLNSHLYKSILGININRAIKINKDLVNSKYFSGDLLRYTVEHHNLPQEIIDDSLTASDENTVLFASLHSRGVIGAKKVESYLVDLMLKEKIGGSNFSIFENAFFTHNDLDAKVLFDACFEKTAEWERQEYNSALISCISFLKNNKKEALDFLKKQFNRKSLRFIEYFERSFQSYRKFDDIEISILRTLVHDDSISTDIKLKLEKILLEQEKQYGV